MFISICANAALWIRGLRLWPIGSAITPKTSVSVSSGEESIGNTWDGSHFVTTRIAAANAYKEAGINDPREEISMCEVHDCFSITELVTMEDLHVSERGQAWRDVMDGVFDRDGKQMISKSQFDTIAKTALGDGSVFYNHEDLDLDDFLMVLEAAWDGERLDQSLIRKG